MAVDLFMGVFCLIAGVALITLSGRAACTVADFADEDPAGNRPTLEWFGLIAGATLALLFSGAFLAQAFLP